MKQTVINGDCRAEYDTDADTYTRWLPDGVTIDEQRPLTAGERTFLLPPATQAQLDSLTDAVNQLVLDALMGA